jgi:hypothetical protein
MLLDDPTCTPLPTVVRQASNIVLYGRDTNVAQREEIEQREGFVTCALSRGPEFPSTVDRIHYSGDEETYFRLLNVTCIIYPDPPNAEVQLARLGRTMKTLERDLTKANR